MKIVLVEVDRLLDREHRVRMGRVEHLQPQAIRPDRRTTGGSPRARARSRPCRAAPHPCSPRTSAAWRRRSDRPSCSSIVSATFEPAESVLDLRHAGAAPQRLVVLPDALRRRSRSTAVRMRWSRRRPRTRAEGCASIAGGRSMTAAIRALSIPASSACIACSNSLMPSSSSCSVTAVMSIPAACSAASSALGSSRAVAPGTVPWSATALSVASGIVLTV